MRLLVIEPGLRLWGSERALLATVPDLVAANKAVVVMTPHDAELITPLLELGVTIEPAAIGNLHRSGRIARLRAAIAIIRACRRHRIEKIYLNQAGLCRIVERISALMCLPLIIHIRLIEDIERCAKLPNSRLIDLICVSRDMYHRFPKDGNNRKRLVKAYDPFVLPHKQSHRSTSRNRDLCCVGRIAKFKGQADLIEGIAIARARGVGVKLDIIGAATSGDSYEANLLRCTEPLIAEGVIRFLGYRTDVPALMGQYRFVAVPSHYETLGRVVMEAWGAGALPICSRNAGGCSEIVTACNGGILYDGHEPAAIAEAIASAMTMPEAERYAAVERGRLWARQNLSLEAYRRALSSVIFPTASVTTDPPVGENMRYLQIPTEASGLNSTELT